MFTKCKSKVLRTKFKNARQQNLNRIFSASGKKRYGLASRWQRFKIKNSIDAYLVYFYIKAVNMSRQSISFTEPNNEWLNSLVESKEYSSKSELVNDLIRQARKQQVQIDWIRAKLEKAEQDVAIFKKDVNNTMNELNSRVTKEEMDDVESFLNFLNQQTQD